MSSQFNNLIKTESIASITPQQILAAGESIFLDVQTSPDINSINKAIQAYSKIHAPIYGQPIPLSGAVASADGSETLLAPGNNEVRRVIAVSATNTGGGAPIIFNVTLGGMVIKYGVAVAPAAIEAITFEGGLYCSKNLPLAIVVTSGTAADLTSSVASILLTQ